MLGGGWWRRLGEGQGRGILVWFGRAVAQPPIKQTGIKIAARAWVMAIVIFSAGTTLRWWTRNETSRRVGL